MTRDPFAPDDLDFDGPVEAVLPDEIRAEHHALLRSEAGRGSRARRFVLGVSVGVAAVAVLVATVVVWRPAPMQEPIPTVQMVVWCVGSRSSSMISMDRFADRATAITACRDALAISRGAISLSGEGATVCPRENELVVDFRGFPCRS